MEIMTKTTDTIRPHLSSCRAVNITELNPSGIFFGKIGGTEWKRER